ncbi:MAG: hypothetical protein RLZ37_2166 [Actinomycetota bacterium]
MTKERHAAVDIGNSGEAFCSLVQLLYQTELVVFRIVHDLETVGQLLVCASLSCRTKLDRMANCFVEIVDKVIEMDSILPTLPLRHALECKVFKTNCYSDLLPVRGIRSRINHSPNK